MKRTRILLADDHTMMLAGLQKLLEPECEVIGSVTDGRALLQTAKDLRPDVAVVDVGMPLLNGLDAGRQLKALMPHIKLIFLTMNPDPDIASEAFRIGASAYLLKTSQGEELLQAVRNAIRGISYVTSEIRHAMEQSFIRNPKTPVRPRHLTDRQLEILQMLAEGRSMKEIAYILQISFRTVRFHKYRVMEELRIGTTAELVQYAIKSAIISPSVGPHWPK
jgi:DNA-binding NarL/FixJ family response regulator